MTAFLLQLARTSIQMKDAGRSSLMMTDRGDNRSLLGDD
jgi:hypothetical protein